MISGIVSHGLPRIAAAVAKAMLEHLGEAKKSLRRAAGLNGE